MTPLALGTIAALTPSKYHIDLWDEAQMGLLDVDAVIARGYSLIGITSYSNHFYRASSLADELRRRGQFVVSGGPGVSAAPERWRGHADVLFIDEAELTWPRFLNEWEQGKHAAEYRQVERPNLAYSPIPRWEGIPGGKLDAYYGQGSVQTTRGCPFDCDFCDVIYLFGRKQRHKPVETVIAEVKNLQRLGMKSIFFADDEFVGDKQYAKALLRSLIPVNNSFQEPLLYSTQATLNMSKDEELLYLMADANLTRPLIGIESPSIDALKSTNKRHNIRKDMVAEVHKILSYGIGVRGSFIIGFDTDGPEIFEIHKKFYHDACLPSFQVFPLSATDGTNLWTRLRQEGRVLDQAKSARARYFMPFNIIPKKMSRIELMEGFICLLEAIAEWSSLSERLRGYVSLVKRAPEVRETQPTLQDPKRLADILGVDPRGRKAIDEVMEHAMQVAPFMMKQMVRFIEIHEQSREFWFAMIKMFHHCINVEKRADIAIKFKEIKPLRVPPAFVSAYRAIFAQFYGQVYRNLRDKRAVPEVLVQVFVDFLVRWGGNMEKIEARHTKFLEELCDRTCAKLNGESPETFVQTSSDDTPLPNWKEMRLDEAVLKSIGDELVRIQAGGEGFTL